MHPGVNHYDDPFDAPIVHKEDFKDRHDHCTDLPCCCLWVICLFAFGGVMGYGFINGNLKRLHHGIDHTGRVCGLDTGVEALPYTYFCAPTGWTSGALTSVGINLLQNPVCVATCPVSATATDAVAPATIPECAPTFSTTAYKTSVKIGYCMPDSTLHAKAEGEIGKAITGFVPTLLKIADSIIIGWPIYIGIFFISIVLGYLYLCCLKVFAKPMVYLAILISFLALTIIGAFMIYQAPTIGTNEIMANNFGNFATTMAYVIGGLSCLAALGIVCLVCCCHHQIDYAVLAVQMTTDVMAHIPSLLFAPVVKAIIKFSIAMVLLVGFVYLLTIAKPQAVAGSAMARTFEYQQHEYLLIVYYVFMFGWVMAFLTAVYQFCIAYATADYFYSEAMDYDGTRDVGCCNMVEGLCVGLMWHQGSFAFGSAIIAAFSLIQRSIEYIDRSNRDPSGRSMNPLVTILTCCCMCCVTMCKSCAEFINKNAYIGIAIKGDPFCTACRKALKIMIDNAAGMAILNGATFVFQIAGIVLITACCAFIADLFCNLTTFKDPTSDRFLPHPPVTVVVSALIAMAMAKIFMDVFDMVSDTLMYCFGLEGYNKGSARVPRAVAQAVGEAEQMEYSGSHTKYSR